MSIFRFLGSLQNDHIPYDYKTHYKLQIYFQIRINKIEPKTNFKLIYIHQQSILFILEQAISH